MSSGELLEMELVLSVKIFIFLVILAVPHCERITITSAVCAKKLCISYISLPKKRA